MSGGSILGGVVGAVAGYFMPGGSAVMALKGMQMGMTIGGYLDPPKGPTITGPRLDDLTIQTSTYGAFIPRGYGTFPVMGNVFWIENNKLKEKVSKKKSGGKGGGGSSTTKTYTYYATFAVGLCRGPITGVRRIWIGSKLIYNASSLSYDALISSNLAATGFNLHLGDDTQLPDSRMQATLGVANTPAYRGLAYLVFKDLLLTDYGNTIQGAQVKVEVVKNGTIQRYRSTIVTHPVPCDFRSIIVFKNKFVAIGVTPNTITTSSNGGTWTIQPNPVSGTWGYGKLGATSEICAFAINSSSERSIMSKNGLGWTAGGNVSGVVLRNIIEFQGALLASSGYDTQIYRSENGLTWATIALDPADEAGVFLIANNSIALSLKNFNSTKYLTSYNGFFWTERTLPVNGTWGNGIYANGFFLLFTTTVGGGALKSTNGIDWTFYDTPFDGTDADTAVWDGDYIYVHAASKTYLSTDGITWINYTSNDADVSYKQSACMNGTIVSVGNDGRIAIVRKYSLTVTNPTLDTIVSAECQLGGLTTSDIDVTDLAAKEIRGYRITSPAALKASFDQLQAVYPFDIIQRGYKLKFKARGGSSVVTIPKEDLAALGVS